MKTKRLCVLMILDGWGISTDVEGNAVFLARAPYLDKLEHDYPVTELECSGEAVGLPKGTMGNSEVGHLNIGAGRVIDQDLHKINLAIENGSFIQNKTFLSVISNVKQSNSSLHLMGLVSDGGVHSHINHLFALLDLAKANGLEKVYIHPILDGRDTSPKSGLTYINVLQSYIKENKIGKIATLCGRYYAMDRDQRWERVEKAYNLYTQGNGRKEKEPEIAIKKAYKQKETDEFISPIVIVDDNGKPVAKICDNDGVIFFNFRADRAREITKALTSSNFSSFKREIFPKLSEFVCLTMYDEHFPLPIAFPPAKYKNILGQVLSDKGYCQLRIAETEKYAHVTYFFNGGMEKEFNNEERVLIQSPKDVATYDLKPEMSALMVTDELLKRIKKMKKYDFIVCNFANMDMVGHTGNLEATIKAIESIDRYIYQIVTEVKAQDGVVIIIGDHGNAEKMLDQNGSPHTAHTLNPVRFILADDRRKDVQLKKGALGDVAPTILEIMEVEKPAEMTGKSLIDK